LLRLPAVTLRDSAGVKISRWDGDDLCGRVRPRVERASLPDARGERGGGQIGDRFPGRRGCGRERWLLDLKKSGDAADAWREVKLVLSV
jgi:hypothetical protein